VISQDIGMTPELTSSWASVSRDPDPASGQVDVFAPEPRGSGQIGADRLVIFYAVAQLCRSGCNNAGDAAPD
jgi:hypothetical protein